MGQVPARDAAGRFLPAQGKERPRKKEGRWAPWTAEKETIFFRELAMVCNVAAALRAARMTSESRKVYDRRRADPEFRRRWEEAIAESYAMLELEMLERARLGDERPPPASDAEKKLRSVPTPLALQLLKLHRSPAARTAPAAAPAALPPGKRPLKGDQLLAKLEARFAAISRRLGGAG